jgi:hypothetical protein
MFGAIEQLRVESMPTRVERRVPVLFDPKFPPDMGESLGICLARVRHHAP